MSVAKLTEADSLKARELWADYQRRHALSGRKGDTAGIDVFSGRIWIGKSIADVISQRDVDGIDAPLFFERVGSATYYRKRGLGQNVRATNARSRTMDVSVMLEQVQGNGYRATALAPVPLVAEAPTRDEAVNRIRTLITEKLSHVELIQIEVSVATHPNPWLAIAGTWRDHPDLDEVVENIKEYRREIDADSDRV